MVLVYNHGHERKAVQGDAVANGLNPFEYFKYLLEGILAHLDDPPTTYIEDLLPWSDRIPEICRKKITEDR